VRPATHRNRLVIGAQLYNLERADEADWYRQLPLQRRVSSSRISHPHGRLTSLMITISNG